MFLFSKVRAGLHANGAVNSLPLVASWGGYCSTPREMNLIQTYDDVLRVCFCFVFCGEECTACFPGHATAARTLGMNWCW